ncbi:MAG: DUF2868 domain-containing protein [Planctomycetota bacterium]|jgi:hypothetical protein|nr:DUF2868 domain-containing protein [Planctomycetota bacterium]
MTWQLADIIDLEAQLAWDRVAAHHQGGQAEGLDARDRAIGQAVRDQHQATIGDQALLHGWVAAMRERSDHLPGARVVAVLNLLRAIGAVIAAIIGVTAASAVLHYDGSRPVPVLLVLALLVGIPGLLLLTTLALQLPGLRRLFARSGGPLQWLCTQLALPLLRRALPSDAPPGFAAALSGNLARRAGGSFVYLGLLRASLASLVQQLGLISICAALITLLLRVVVSDIAFAWGSSLAVDAAWMGQWVDALSWPWAWAWTDGVPSESLIEASRYNHLEDRFSGAEGLMRADNAAALSAWWRFLAASIAVWAVAPRAITSFVFSRLFAAQCAQQGQRSEALLDHQEQLQRLRNTGAARFRNHGAAPVPPPAPHEAAAQDWPEGAATVIVWDQACDETQARTVIAASGGSVAAVSSAGYGSDAAVDRAAVQAVAAASGPVTVVVAGDEQALAEPIAFLRDLRHAAARRELVVLLVGPAAEADRDDWAAALHALEPARLLHVPEVS